MPAKVIRLPERQTNPRKGKARRYVISRTLPTAIPPAPGFESFVERFERKHLGGYGVIHKPLMEADVPTIIQVPRKQTAGSITDDQVKEVHATVKALKPREAVVVCDNHDSENGARGRARSLAERYAEDYPFLLPDGAPTKDENAEGATVNPTRYLTAHAIPDPNNEGKWIGAVSVREKQEPGKPRPKAAAKKPAAKTPPATS